MNDIEFAAAEQANYYSIAFQFGKEIVSVPDARVSSLATRHAALDDRIGAEERRPRPDEILLAMLKKQKLRLKEALMRK